MTTTPLTDALRAAQAAATAADVAWSECEHGPEERCEHRIATDVADAAVDAAREALRDSREPREWTLSHDGHTYGTTVARSAADALRVARRDVDPADYDGCSWPLIVEVSVRCEATGESDSDTTVVDQPEPECSSDEGHDWQSPLEIVGGIAENPGVWGNGGGVICREACLRCGCGRITDTWAQDPSTGRLIGHDVVTYEPDLYADEVAGVEEAAEHNASVDEEAAQ